MRTWTRLTACSLLALALVACKQGIGERCQIDDDCEPGLICAQTSQQFSTCRERVTTSIDAAIDATIPDAGIDAVGADAVSDAEPADADFDAPP